MLIHEKSKLIPLIGERIRQLRKQKKLSILELASICSMSEKHLGQIERAKSNISLDLLEKIALALETEVYTLLQPKYHEKTSKYSEKTMSNRELKYALFQLIETSDTRVLQRYYRILLACKD